MFQTYEKNKFDLDRTQEISKELVQIFKKRRTTRIYEGFTVPDEIIDRALEIAGSAPSGANKQPWLFCKISSGDQKREIRQLSEVREKEFYVDKPNFKWLADLKQFNTDENKGFLENASHLIPVFYKNSEILDCGERSKNYYAKESTGIACGMLISALHLFGLQTLTYTPSKMSFMREYLGIDSSYISFMMIVVGVAPQKYLVPDIKKKTLSEISKNYVLEI